MEFTQYSCPVCGERFANGDDVVVCPECGTPHHRECYERSNRCFYEDKHAENYNFASSESGEEETKDDSGFITCTRCGAENEHTAFYCSTCGFPLNAEDRAKEEAANRQQTNNRAQGMPFGFGNPGAAAFDPLAGMRSEDEIAENVKVGEAAKYIGKNTPYYLTVFNRIRQSSMGRFNLSAFLFSGAFFIYRKMYIPGIILALMMIGITVGSACIILSNNWMTTMEYSDLLTGITDNTLGADKMAALMINSGLNLLRIGIMLFSGFSANKLYYRHCTKQINRIKSENKDKNEDLHKAIEARGGVNLPMAISFFAAFAVIYEICNIYVFLS